METQENVDGSHIALFFGRCMWKLQQYQCLGDVAMFPPTGSGEIARRFLGSLTHGT